MKLIDYDIDSTNIEYRTEKIAKVVTHLKSAHKNAWMRLSSTGNFQIILEDNEECFDCTKYFNDLRFLGEKFFNNKGVHIAETFFSNIHKPTVKRDFHEFHDFIIHAVFVDKKFPENYIMMQARMPKYFNRVLDTIEKNKKEYDVYITFHSALIFVDDYSFESVNQQEFESELTLIPFEQYKEMYNFKPFVSSIDTMDRFNKFIKWYSKKRIEGLRNG
jgi:hypothetical protein